MSKKKENIVTHSDAELRAMKAAGQTHSDWKSAAQKPIPDGSDPDDAMEPVDWATTELPMPKRKSLAPDAFLLSGASWYHLARPYGIPAGDVRGF